MIYISVSFCRYIIPELKFSPASVVICSQDLHFSRILSFSLPLIQMFVGFCQYLFTGLIFPLDSVVVPSRDLDFRRLLLSHPRISRRLPLLPCPMIYIYVRFCRCQIPGLIFPSASIVVYSVFHLLMCGCMVAFRKMVPILPILVAIVFFVLLRYTDSDCPFGIFKLFISFGI